MNPLNPVYTEKTSCVDCYKCVRNCSVKAISIKEQSACVEAEKCIGCGTCVKVCPSGAKKVRDDLMELPKLLKENKIVFASVAPSIISEFPDIGLPKLISFLKKLGFYGVSETALGAQLVSAQIAKVLQKNTNKQRIMISSACPVIVRLIQNEYPEISKYITPFYSPLLTHSQLLRHHYGEDIKIVFFGPCIAKKFEADQHAFLDLALSFEDLRTLIKQFQTEFEQAIPNSSDSLIPSESEEGRIYPVDGGMIKTIQANGSFNNVHFISLSGLEAIRDTLENLEQLKDRCSEDSIFLELLACPGGCINGPLTQKSMNLIQKNLIIQKNTKIPILEVPRPVEISIETDFSRNVTKDLEISETDILKALQRVGKMKKKDELNCGGCGYDSCRNFAKALIMNRAEETMCVSYMRNLANKKANALITAMPAGVVILDNSMTVIECNLRFVELLVPEMVGVYENPSTLKGMLFKKIFPEALKYLEKVKEENIKIIDKEIEHNNMIIKVSIFPIEKSNVFGMIIQDITEPAVNREHIINKAQEVIKKNLKTAQQIAFLLGENAAESETILNSIIKSFSQKSEK